MGRTTKVVGFSLPPQLHKQIEAIASRQHKTRSEFMREIINLYLNSSADSRIGFTPTDLAQVLQTYWQMKATSPLSILLVGLGIVTNNKNEVLIGSRTKQPDNIVKNLTWSFPSSQLKTLDFANELEQAIKRSTGQDVIVHNLITARVFPDSTLESTQVIALYFGCKLKGSPKSKRDDTYKEIKWVNALEVFKYFTTSTSDEVAKYLATLDA